MKPSMPKPKKRKAETFNVFKDHFVTKPRVPRWKRWWRKIREKTREWLHWAVCG